MKAKTHLSQTKSRGGFTLVEMLVVIGMIAALAGISFPVYRGIQKKVEKQKFEMLCTSLDRAFVNFETEYNHPPYTGAVYPTGDQYFDTAGKTSALWTVLAGGESSINFKRIKFLAGNEATPSGGTYVNGFHENADGTTSLYFPWGTQPIRLRIDSNMDGLINIPWPWSEESVGKYSIYDPGPNGSFESGTNDDWKSYVDPRL
jgi:prepilin-type N-terminal cleavage/methylation domain-containing protein